MSLFNEFKRRNVFRVGIAYTITAWLIAQIAGLAATSFFAPDWVMKMIITVLMLGFPVALVMAWAYEMTPEGLRREPGGQAGQSEAVADTSKLDRTIIFALVAALTYFAYDKFVLDPGRDAALLESAGVRNQEVAVSGDQPDEPSKATVHSIAVLPFVNMSEDAGNEYFADGLSEELLNLLAKIQGLHVAARTSSFSFKGKDISIPEIAVQLNVAYVLEGSVRKFGNQIRITTQLIQADNGYQLWSETYDRTLDHIFAIQGEIATTVVAQLKVKLLGTVPTIKVTDPEAYTLYLRGLHLNNSNTMEAQEPAIQAFKDALEIEPDYAAAWIGLADAYSFQAGTNVRPYAETFEMTREAANEALSIDPANAAAHAYLFYVVNTWDLDLKTAVQYLSQAIALEPNNTAVLAYSADLALILGKTDEMVSIREHLALRDPLNPSAHWKLGWAYSLNLQRDAAMASYRRALQLNPGTHGIHLWMSWEHIQKGEFQAALEAARQEPHDGFRLIALAQANHYLGKKTLSDTSLEELIEKYEKYAPHEIAYLYAIKGEPNKAFEWLEKTIEHRDSGTVQIQFEQQYTNIHSDPRWLRVLERIGRSPDQLAEIEFNVTLPE